MNGFRLDKYLIPELEDFPIYPFLGPNKNGILVSVEERDKIIGNIVPGPV